MVVNAFFVLCSSGPSLSSVLENTVLSSLSVSYTLATVISPCVEAEKCVLTLHVSQDLVNDADMHEDVSEKDRQGGCVDEGETQRDPDDDGDTKRDLGSDGDEREAQEHVVKRKRREVADAQKDQNVDSKNELCGEHNAEKTAFPSGEINPVKI